MIKKVRTVLSFVTFFGLLGLVFFKLTQGTDIAKAATDSEWYMAGANPQRTSWVSEEVSGALGVDWYRAIEAYIPGKVQIIGAENKIFLSTAKGLYAFNPASGALLWTYPTELPLGNSPTVVNSVAYVGGFDHKMYAIDATSGQKLWSFDGATAGYDTNPLVVNGLVIMGNRDGGVYAVYSNDDATRKGTLAWKYQTDGQVHFSASYKDGKVYVASDDAYLYALDVTNGSLVWKSDTDPVTAGYQKLPVTSFNSWWPVIYHDAVSNSDVVLLVGPDNYRFVPPFDTEGLQNLDASDYLVPKYGTQGDIGPKDANGRMDISSASEYYEVPNPDDVVGRRKAWRRTYFVIDANTGVEKTFDLDSDGRKDYAPFFWWGTRSGMRYPAVIGGDQKIYQPETYRVNGQYSTRGQIVGWEYGTPWITTPYGNSTEANDEPMGYSAGGNTIYWNLCCDRAAGSTKVDGSNKQSYFSYNLAALAPNYNVKSTGTGESNAVEVYGANAAGTGYNNQPEGLNGVYGSHGDVNPPIPYQGRLYMHRGNALIAFAPNSPTRDELPIVTNQSVSEPVVAADTVSLTAKLESEVQKIISAGHLRPGYGIHGYFTEAFNYNFGDQLMDYFHTSVDTLFTLTMAYPHLNPTLQGQVSSYLANEMTNYSPCVYRTNGWGGASRENTDLPPEVTAAIPSNGPSEYDMYGYPGWSWPPHLFYALWKYALINGNASQLFNSCKDKLGTPPSNSTLITYPEAHNAWIAGLTGYVELAKLAGNNTEANAKQTILNDLTTGSRSRAANLAQTINSAWGPESHDSRQVMSIARNFMYLTPETASYLKTNSASSSNVVTAFNLYNRTAPYWMATKFEASYGESILAPLFDTNSMFLAKAWIMGANREELAKYLDSPVYARGDYFYMQNLIATIEAPAAIIIPTPTPEPTLVPTLTPTPEPTLIPTPTEIPTPSPTPEPTAIPTETPIPSPTIEPTLTPTPEPTLVPTATPTPEPTLVPTATPMPTPTDVPTPTVTPIPTATPTPTLMPTATPTPPAGTVLTDNLDPINETWSTSITSGADDWVLSTARANSPTHSFFAAEPAVLRDARLTTREFVVPTYGKLSFWHTYQTETASDGAVVEISTDGGNTFTDLGAQITSGGYNGVINNDTSSAIHNRNAWTGGTLGTMSQVVVNLAPYVGSNAIIRFRMVSDIGTSGLGWYIDDILVKEDNSATITKSISTGNDDARQVGTSLNLTATTTYLGRDTTETNSYTGFRFTGLNIPRGATILNAYLSVYSTSNQTAATTITMYGEATGNSAAYSSTNKLATRVSTAASFSTVITNSWSTGQWYSLPDISPVVQEIVNRSDWNSGNSMSIITSNVSLLTGRRVFRTYNGNTSQAPRLVVTYR